MTHHLTNCKSAPPPTTEMREWLDGKKKKTGCSISFVVRGSVLQAMEMEKREGVRK